MTTPEQPDTSKPARSWVWHSTDESIAAGQISLLSVLETFCALGLYGWLAFHFEHQWWLLISAVAAPIILLRSPESKTLGVKWLRNYQQDNREDWQDFSLTEKLLLVGVPFVVTGLLTWWLASLWLSGHEGWELFWRAAALSAIAGAIAIAIALAFAVAGVGVGAFAVAGVGAFAGAVAGVGAFAGAVAVAVAVAGAFAVVGADSQHRWIKIPATLILLILFMPAFAAGVWLRGLLIRIFATLLHPIAGLRHLPENWRETIAVIDFSHPPELLPGAIEVNKNLTVRGLLQDVQSITDKDSWMAVITAVMWYPPAMMWRWSLKATLWLWFPLALLLRPDKAVDNVGKVRKAAVAQIWVSGLLLWVAIITALWLGTGHFSAETVQSWAELAGENTGKWLEKLLAFTTPPTGLLEATLWLCCGLVGLVWLYSQYVQKQTPKALAEEDAIYEMHEEPKQMFLAHSRWLARLYTFLVVSFILLGYAVVMHLANAHYQQELARFVPTWLIGWL
jgi:hypothetical protein